MIARVEPSPRPPRRVRYAVVGLGHIAQAAILPAFRHAAENSELAALVSGDPKKRDVLGRRYGVPAVPYPEFEPLLEREEIDAAFIALPNDLHREFAVRAARAGVHALCEKPLAPTSADCEAMIRAADGHGVRLMVAYRLHFEKANLEAAEIARSGRIGEPRVFASTFTMQVAEGNIRLRSRKRGGGPLYDIGVYCINAARNLFRDEPVDVVALAGTGPDGRFGQVEEAAGAVLRFPGGRLATFTCSFGAADAAEYRLVGTRGHVRLEPAYEYAEALTRHLSVEGRTSTKTHGRRDQFAAEILYFSDCLRAGREPEPSGLEGLADVRVLEAIYRSIETGSGVALPPFRKDRRPSASQEIRRPPSRKPPAVNVRSPHPPGAS